MARRRIPVSPNQMPLFGEPAAPESRDRVVPDRKQMAPLIGSLMPVSQDIESLVTELPDQNDRNSQEEMIMSRAMALAQLGKESQLASLVTNELPQRNMWHQHGNKTPRMIEAAEKKRALRVKTARALFIRSTGKATLKEGVTLFDVRGEQDLDFGVMPEDKKKFLVEKVDEIVQQLRGTQGAQARKDLQKQLKKLAKDNDIVLPKVK